MGPTSSRRKLPVTKSQTKGQKRGSDLQAAEGGRSARRCLVRITGPDASRSCSTPRPTQQRCEPSLYIRGLQDGDWEHSSWRELKQRLERQGSVDMRWARR